MSKIIPYSIPFITSLLLAVISTSCGLKDEAERLPAFIQIDSVSLTTNSSLQGSNSQNVTEAWVYVDNKLEGVYSLPLNAPILAEGSKELIILPGIKRNSQTTGRVNYPFYNSFNQTVTFSKLDTAIIKPIFTYRDNLNFWIEEFEELGTKLIPVSNSDTGLTITNDKNLVFEGSGSGHFVLSEGKNTARAASNQRFKFPKGQAIFLELNYKTNQDLIIGLVIHTPSNTGIGDILQEHLYLVSTLENGVVQWKKSYVDLSTVVNNQGSITDFDVYFELRRSGEVTVPEAFIDNLKIIYFK